jgi:AcrR family transcriptional regulator
MTSGRPYRSVVRQRQADETRRRIADAARSLFQSAGFERTTIEAIARGAGVAPQTVYAVFRTKRGILSDLLDRAAFGNTYDDVIRQAVGTPDPAERLRFAGRIARHIYDARQAEMSRFRVARERFPELIALEREAERGRYEAQGSLVAELAEAGQLRPELDVEAARDILWALTGQELYRMLIQDRGWSSERYEQWIVKHVCDALLGSTTGPRPAEQIPSRRPLR